MELWRDGPEESLQQLMNDLVLLEQPSFIYAGGVQDWGRGRVGAAGAQGRGRGRGRRRRWLAKCLQRWPICVYAGWLQGQGQKAEAAAKGAGGTG